MLGVTGPNEYENNINNNWHTNRMAVWCLKYALQALDSVRQADPARYADLMDKLSFDRDTEPARWTEIIEQLHFPHDDKHDIFLQQDGYLDKEQIGLAAMVLVVTGVFGVAADWGMGLLTVQRRKIGDRRATGIAAAAGLCSALAVALPAPWIASLFGEPESLVPLLRAGALALLIAGLASTARARSEVNRSVAAAGKTRCGGSERSRSPSAP